jgi:REP element-mobilizing transposase RayT
MLWRDGRGRRIAIVEITIRCQHGRKLLLPTARNTSLLLGVLGRAQKMYDFEIYGYAYLSNHGSILIGVRNPKHASDIMGYIHGNIALELGRKENSDWSDNFWERRGRPIPVLTDTSAEERLRYMLSNSTKEDLVTKPILWPGAHSARALCSGKNDVGRWISHTQLSSLNRNRPDNDQASEEEATTYYEVKLSKLPHLRHKTDKEYRQYCRRICREITRAAVKERKETGGDVMGVEKILNAHPHDRPATLSKSPAPPIHCNDNVFRKWFDNAYRAFATAYRIAHAALREGIAIFQFPEGGILPGYCFTCIDTG